MKIRSILLSAMMVGLSVSASAASLSLVPVEPADGPPNFVVSGPDRIAFTGPGTTLTFDLLADFSDVPTIGGGFSITWDTSAFDFVSYTSANAGDPAFGMDPTLMDGILFDGAIGNFTPLSGTFLLGTIVVDMTTAMPGDYLISPIATTGIGGPWIDGNTFVDEIDVNYRAMTVTIIPVPAAVWFMLSGLAALFGFARRRAS